MGIHRGIWVLFWKRSRIKGYQGVVRRSLVCRVDFNVVRFPSKHSSGSRLNATMRRISNVINDLELRILPLIEGSFTWCGGQDNRSSSRLDHFLVFEGSESKFNRVIQRVFPKLISDHSPILLEGRGFRNGLNPFRFENMWLNEEGFYDMVKGWWLSLDFSSSSKN